MIASPQLPRSQQQINVVRVLLVEFDSNKFWFLRFKRKLPTRANARKRQQSMSADGGSPAKKLAPVVPPRMKRQASNDVMLTSPSHSPPMPKRSPLESLEPKGEGSGGTNLTDGEGGGSSTREEFLGQFVSSSPSVSGAPPPKTTANLSLCLMHPPPCAEKLSRSHLFSRS